jgi:hypothetical protein
VKKILTPLLIYFLSAILFYAHGQTSKSIQKIELAEISSSQRYALLIGNAKYNTFPPLTNPVNDARAMSRTLLKLGFKVELLVDASQKKMKKAIDRFGKQLKQARFGLFYYSGHGMQVDGLNYLIPVDAKINGESDVEYESVNAGRVLGKMKDSKNSMNLVILDACRNNPFVSSYKSVNPGLAIINAPTGTLIAYATAPGRVASDGKGSNGLYTGELLRHIKMPGLKLEEVFKKVRANVQTKSNGKQVPWESSSLIGDFYFVPPLKTADSVQKIAKLEKDLKKLSEQKEKELKAEQQKLAILQQQLVDEQERLEEGNILFFRFFDGKWIWFKGGDQTKDSKFQGVTKNGEPNGQGTLNYINGDKYTGQWKDGKKDGLGLFTWINGKKYEGQFRNGKRHGQGTFTYSEKSKYTGQWKDGKKDGLGSMFREDGSEYHGMWKEDKINRDKKDTIYNIENVIKNYRQKFVTPEFVPPELRLEELFPEEIKLKGPLKDLGITEKTLIRKKGVQLAIEEYNLHIRTHIIPKLGTYPTELFVRIELRIIASGKIIEYKVIAKSGFPSFDQAAELAVRNAVLDPLPQALAENPPYIVLIRIVPNN